MSLGSKLKELRTSHKMTLQEMADALNKQNKNSNFNKGRLSKWEHDTDEPRLSSLKQVADLFNVSIDYFFDKDDNTSENNEVAQTVAAHIDDDTPEEERQQIINFIENLKKLEVIIMYAYEELASEYPHLTINYPQNMPDNLAGLNIDTDVYLNRANSDIKMYEILQEEIAHYDTTAGDIVTKDTPDGRKQELKARSLAMTRAVSLDKLIHCYQHDIWDTDDIADYCNVDVEYLMKAIDNYRIKRGLVFEYKGYRFDLRKNVKIEKL